MPTDSEIPLDDARTVVLVEGVSDQLAVEALAALRGRDLLAEKAFVLPMGGATNIGHFLDRFGPSGANLRLAGLCDEAEVRVFQRGLARAGLGDPSTRTELESRHFYVCAADLEDELIRALGTAAVEQILDANGDLTAFRTFQQQPAQQGRSTAAHLLRFMGTRGGRKIHYAPVLAGSLQPDRAPRALENLLDAL